MKTPTVSEIILEMVFDTTVVEKMSGPPKSFYVVVNMNVDYTRE